MASWSELLSKAQKGVSQNPGWLENELKTHLSNISKLREGTSVIFYASAFLQKQNAGNGILISREDINGFMNALYEAETENGLTLILHTPGGDPNAVESIVEYLHAKFKHIEVIVPYLAMSGGAMISLASDLLILGKQSQLGPIDPQLLIENKIHPARAIKEGFERAKKDIGSNQKLAHLWAPILQSMGPSLVLEAEKALSYSKDLVVNWLKKRMFKDVSEESQKDAKANTIAKYFNAEDTDYGNIHVHGQRIGVEKLTELGVKVELLEENQDLQSEVLTSYHLMTLIFEMLHSVKFIGSDKGKMWAKLQSIAMLPPLQPVSQRPQEPQPKKTP
ncbi:SDH family Clp fold serine proteinase [Candidatus Mycalebacterium sp.]